jgi:hypothetical protein
VVPLVVPLATDGAGQVTTAWPSTLTPKAEVAGKLVHAWMPVPVVELTQPIIAAFVLERPPRVHDLEPQH